MPPINCDLVTLSFAYHLVLQVSRCSTILSLVTNITFTKSVAETQLDIVSFRKLQLCFFTHKIESKAFDYQIK